jgi:hypothetical protein
MFLISKMESLQDIIQKNRYLVIEECGRCALFPSLRQSASHAAVDHSTLSKKLKNKERCICKSKASKKEFYVLKLPST